MSENATNAPDGASNKALAALSDFDLDQKIGKQNQMIESALAARDDALKAVTKCEKSAVISAWRLGQFLIEKKRRLGHGQWFPWLSTVGLGERQARRYLRLAEIGLESDLDVSITATIDQLDHRGAELQKAAREDMELARSWWRTWLDGFPHGTREWHAIFQSVPDGPVSGKLWLNFLDAIDAATTDEERRNAYERRPWTTP